MVRKAMRPAARKIGLFIFSPFKSIAAKLTNTHHLTCHNAAKAQEKTPSISDKKDSPSADGNGVKDATDSVAGSVEFDKALDSLVSAYDLDDISFTPSILDGSILNDNLEPLKDINFPPSAGE